jgi:hypothetical protein
MATVANAINVLFMASPFSSIDTAMRLSNEDSHSRFERSMNEVTESRHDADPSVTIK